MSKEFFCSIAFKNVSGGKYFAEWNPVLHHAKTYGCELMVSSNRVATFFFFFFSEILIVSGEFTRKINILNEKSKPKGKNQCKNLGDFRRNPDLHG